MSNNTIITQGTFVSNGAAQLITLRQDVDWMEVYNYTQLNNISGTAGTESMGVKYYWQRGMAANDAIITLRNAGATADFMTTAAAITAGVGGTPTATNGFTLFNNTINTPGPVIATTGITNATPPVVTVASTAGLSTGNIVRIYNQTGAHQIDGYDFSITVINGTTFSLTYATTVVMAGAAATAGFYAVIPYTPYFYPSNRRIIAISQAASAVVTVNVAHTWQVGQLVQFNIPPAFGMQQLDGMVGTITAVTAGTFTVNINTTGFTAFSFPNSATAVGVPFTPAQVIPFGEAAYSPYGNLLDDAVYNQGLIGMQLGACINTAVSTSPAGLNGEVMYWVAGKSFSTVPQ